VSAIERTLTITSLFIQQTQYNRPTVQCNAIYLLQYWWYYS